MPSRSRPVTSMRAACRRAKDSATRARAPVGSGWARRVPTTHSVASAGAVASRWARVRRVASSAQCRSSSTTSSGVVVAASTTRRAMSFQRANADWAGVSSAVDGLVLDGRAPERLEHRAPRPQRRSPVVLRAPADGDGEAAPTGLLRQVLDEPGLADAGLPHDLGRGEAAGGRRVELRGQRRPLGVATDRDRIGRRYVGPRRRGGRGLGRGCRRRQGALDLGRLAEHRRLQCPQLAGRGRCRAPRPAWSVPSAAPRGRRPAGRRGPGPGRGWPTTPRAAGAARWRTPWSPAPRRGRRPPAGPAAGPPRRRRAAARATTARPGRRGGRAGRRTAPPPTSRARRRGGRPRPRPPRASASRVRDPSRTATPAAPAPDRPRVPPRRTRARRPPWPAPAGRSRGRWSR